jgi:hypothetical protein
MPVESLTSASFQGAAEFSFKGAQAGFEKCSLGNDDDVEPGCNFVTAKDVPDQALRPVPGDRSAELPGGGDAQPADRQSVGKEEKYSKPAVSLRALRIHPLKFFAASNPFVRLKSSRSCQFRHWLSAQARPAYALFTADGQAFPALGAPALENQTAVFSAHPNQKPMGACAPALVGLKCALAFHDRLSLPGRDLDAPLITLASRRGSPSRASTKKLKRIANVSERLCEVSTRVILC